MTPFRYLRRIVIAIDIFIITLCLISAIILMSVHCVHKIDALDRKYKEFSQPNTIVRKPI